MKRNHYWDMPLENVIEFAGDRLEAEYYITHSIIKDYFNNSDPSPLFLGQIGVLKSIDWMSQIKSGYVAYGTVYDRSKNTGQLLLIIDAPYYGRAGRIGKLVNKLLSPEMAAVRSYDVAPEEEVILSGIFDQTKWD
jgi:hypothetical protein